MDNFYILYGEDKDLIKYELNNIITKIKDADKITYDMTKTTILDIIDDASTIGMFSTKKIIILEDSYFLTANKTIDNLDQLEKYLEHFNPNSYLFFLTYSEKIDTRKKINKLLAKHKIIEVKKKDNTDLKKYAQNYLKENEDIDYFLSHTGSRLSNIKNELDKLIMYKLDQKLITKEDVDKVCIYTSEEEIFSLTDAIIAKDTQKSLNLLADFINKNYDEIQIIMLLASQFRFLFQVKRLINKNKSESEIAKILEVNPYRVKFTIKKIYSYSEDMLLDNIKKIAKMDHDIKLGIMDKKLALELFIATN